MSAQETKLHQFIPDNLAPPAEAINDLLYNYSDLFPPLEDGDIPGILGNYSSKSVEPDSHLWPLAKDFKSIREWARVAKKTRQYGMAMLQMQVLFNIDKSFSNLISDGYTENQATHIISNAIDAQDHRTANYYNFKLDSIYDPPTLGEDETVTAKTHETINNEALRIRRRLQRLKFEWLSAKLIVHELAHATGADLSEKLAD